MKDKDKVQAAFGELYEEFQVLMKRYDLSLAQFTSTCLAWFLTFADVTVPQENRLMLVQKIAKHLGVTETVR